MNVHRPFSALLLVAVAAGCGADDPQLPRENYALIFTEARAVSGGGFVTLPVANFINTTQLAFSSSTQPADDCIVTTYDADQTGTDLGDITYLSPGADVTVASGAQTRELSLVTNPQNQAQTWQIGGGQGGLPYTPGDTITFTGSGDANGFPLFSIKARSAEAFTFTEPAVPAAGQPLVLSWTTTGVAPGSSMLVSLRYNAPNSDELDRQVFCEMVDDGTFSIPATFLVEWRTATERETAFSRWRTEFKQVDGRSFVVVSSNFTVPTQSSTPTFRQAAVRLAAAR